MVSPPAALTAAARRDLRSTPRPPSGRGRPTPHQATHRRLVSPMRELERDLPTTERRPRSKPRSRRSPSWARAGSAVVARRAPPQRAGLEVALAGRDDAAATVARRRGGPALRPRRGDRRRRRARSRRRSPPLRFAGHTSGASALDALEPAGRARAPRPSRSTRCRRSPTATPTSPAAPRAIAGSTPRRSSSPATLAERLGMRPFEVPEERRAAYHAAASIASNFLVALEESAAELLERGRRRRRARAARPARPAHRRELVGARRRRRSPGRSPAATRPPSPATSRRCASIAPELRRRSTRRSPSAPARSPPRGASR